MASTAVLIDRLCERVGTSKTSPAHFERQMVAVWLGEAQRALASDGPILKTYFKGSSQANVEISSLPVPDFFKVCRLEVRRAGVNKRIYPMSLVDPARAVDRTTSSGDVPNKYLVWAGNDASGNNKKGLMFDKNFGTSGVDDLWIWIRQIPKDPVDGGQAMEITEPWQDVCLDYAEMRARGRMAISDRDQAALAKIAAAAWEAGRRKAQDTVDPEFDDEPIVVHDAMGLTNNDEGD